MSQNKHISIPKKIETEDQTDFHFLRRTGIEYIQQLGGNLWTDYNSHDPGITTLEVLSYAITDLGMRMNLNMEDVLASNNVDKDIHTQFLQATEVLPSRPLNEIDYRKLFIDISFKAGTLRPISNCWLVPRNEMLYVDCKTGQLDFESIGEKTKDFNVKGLYDLYVDYSEDANFEPIECEKSNVKTKILERYHSNRGLCEDLVDIKQIETQKVAVCAHIGLVNKADEELVHAKILKTINNYLSPEVHFYSLKQMLEKGQTTDQIFDGPLLDNGFIDDEELTKSQLKNEVRLSDIISEIMKIDGVKEIHEISIAGCDSSVVKQTNNWLICIEKGKKPELCELSSFSYSKGALPLNINDKKVKQYLDTLKKEEIALRDDARQNKELVLPQGTPYDIGNYATVLNEFPDTYGVGISGIIGNPTPEREALAKQLKGYLLFFDQILASYFKHLEKVKEVLSINGDLKRTYFTQALKNIKGFDELVSDYTTDDDDKLTDSLYEELDNSVERRNEVLDHLISRFAETFGDYTFLMKSLYGKSADEIVLNNKENFLSEYKSLSKDRGLGYNYTLDDAANLWNTNNISGVQKRIARLLGIKNYTQRNLSQTPVSIIKTVNGDGKSSYTWKIKDAVGNIILSSVDLHKTEYTATKNLHEAVYQTIQIDEEDLENALGNLDENAPKETLEKLKKCQNDFCLIGNIKIRVSSGDNYYIEIVDNTEEKNVMGTHKTTNPYTSIDTLKDGIREMVRYFKYDFTEEGIFLVEHLLLKPTFKNYKLIGGIGCMSVEETFKIFQSREPVGSANLGSTFEVLSDEEVNSPKDTVEYSDALMSSCEEDCETDVFDPYSYRVSIVLPGFAFRFQDPDFRRYAETVIRQEIPAHVLAKICWVGDRLSEKQTAQSDMSEFEAAFKIYLSDKAKNNIRNLGNSTQNLLIALSHLNNIYRPGRLLDCAVEDDDSLDGKIILGQSNI